MEPNRNTREILFCFSCRIEHFSECVRDGHEISLSAEVDGQMQVSAVPDFRLKVADDGRVEVRYANRFCEHDVRLTFLDSDKFVLLSVLMEGRPGGEQVLRGPPLELILDRLPKTGQDQLLLCFQFLKPTQKFQDDALNNFDYPAVRRRRLMRLNHCRDFLNNRRPTSDRLIPALKGLSISREEPPSSSEPEETPSTKEHVGFPAVHSRRLLLNTRCRFADNRRLTSDRLIPALEGLSVSQEPPPSSESETVLSTNELDDILSSDIDIWKVEHIIELYKKHRDVRLINKINDFFKDLQLGLTGIPHPRYSPY